MRPHWSLSQHLLFNILTVKNKHLNHIRKKKYSGKFLSWKFILAKLFHYPNILTEKKKLNMLLVTIIVKKLNSTGYIRPD